MRKQRVTQQGIVFGIFVMLFVGFALFLPGFSTPDNMIALLQNVAVLGILSLGMAIVIIGRGIDLSMIATLAVPAGLILQMVQNGHSVFAAFAAAAVLAVAFGLINGWLIAYAVCVLGGIGLSGGRGGVLNAVIGTLLIGTILNAMTILDVSYYGQNFIKGVILLIAILADSIVNPRNEETAQQGDI
jgi:ribose/xylose/arabinose/galactoside ABC-type transport system permease subunit